MKLSLEEVEKIAKLSRLELTEEEKGKFPKQMSDILEYVDKLSAVDVSGVEPMSHIVDVRNVMREDAAKPSDKAERDRLVGEFPDKEDDLLKVQAVFS